MSTYSLVDPQLKPLLESYPKLELEHDTLQEVRDRRQNAALQNAALDDGLAVTVQEQLITPEEGATPVRVLIVSAKNADPACMGILHLHGGGYIFGSPEQSLTLTRATAARQNCVIVSVDYRLAPESPYPAALNDSFAALVWMTENAEKLGVNPQHIGVMGDSAGAGLAAALALYTRDHQGPKLAFQNLMFPMLDDRTVVESHPNPVTGEFVWTRECNAFGWEAYLSGRPSETQRQPLETLAKDLAAGTHCQQRPGDEKVSCYAAAARAEDLQGLPPVWIGVGSIDLFLDEDMDYAKRLIRAGVEVELNVYPGAFHGFNGSSDAEIANRARESRQRSLGRFKPN